MRNKRHEQSANLDKIYDGKRKRNKQKKHQEKFVQVRKEDMPVPPVFLSWHEHWHSSTGRICHSASHTGHRGVRMSLVLQEHQHSSANTMLCSSTK